MKIRYNKGHRWVKHINEVDSQLIKAPSQKDRKTLLKKRVKVWEKRDLDRWNEQERLKYKFGIFYKNGYVMRKGFETKEEAEEELSHYTHPEYFQIREILEWA